MNLRQNRVSFRFALHHRRMLQPAVRRRTAPNIPALHKQAKRKCRSQYELPRAYLSGTGVPKIKASVDWLRKPPTWSIRRRARTGIMYMEGEQLHSEGSKTGLEWLRKSAAQGYGPAEYNWSLIGLPVMRHR